MKIKNIECCELEIPFTISFSHAASSRNKTQSILVRIQSECGLTGYGEACPREYVTAESIDSAQYFIAKYKSELCQKISDLTSLKKWLSLYEDDIDCEPAAWCAIELGILDLLAKSKNCTVEALLGIEINQFSFFYTAVLGNNEFPIFSKQSQRFHDMGFFDYKLKLSGKLENDALKLKTIQNMNPKARLRLDANNLWDQKEVVIEYLKSLNSTIFAIEEPLKVGLYSDFAYIAENLAIKVILDESFTKLSQMELLKCFSNDWILNIRISKMGGLLRSIDIISFALKNNIDIIIGAHVGETSILTRAALVAAQVATARLIAQEGAFGRYLLSYDVCDPSLQFTKDAKIELSKQYYLTHGLGIDVDNAFIKKQNFN